MEAELLYRNCRIEAESQIDPETRTGELSFSSETPVERSFGCEVLDHEPDSVDLQRINTAAPLLLEHDRSQQIGVVERAWIDEGEKKGRTRVDPEALGLLRSEKKVVVISSEAEECVRRKRKGVVGEVGEDVEQL